MNLAVLEQRVSFHLRGGRLEPFFGAARGRPCRVVADTHLHHLQRRYQNLCPAHLARGQSSDHPDQVRRLD